MTTREDDGGAALSARWKAMVLAEHAQADRVSGGIAEGDFWKAHAHRFAPQRGGDGADPELEVLLGLLKGSDVVLDVGAGGGRISLPAAQRCREVVAVEPSEAMRNRLAASVAEWGARNFRVVGATWEEAEVTPADVVICSHVMYTVREPAPFVRKLEAHARRLVMVVMFEEVTAAHYFPLWPPVHGEDRLKLPVLPEFKDLLSAMGVNYGLTPLHKREPRGFESTEQAVAESMARLFVAPGSPKAASLEAEVKKSLVAQPDGSVRLAWAAPQQAWLVTFPGTA